MDPTDRRTPLPRRTRFLPDAPGKAAWDAPEVSFAGTLTDLTHVHSCADGSSPPDGGECEFPRLF